MIAGAELAAWLASHAAQDRSLDGLESFARRWGASPLMSDLERELSENRMPTPGAVLAAATRFLDRRAEIEALVADLIASARADRFFRPPFLPVLTDIYKGLLLFTHPDLTVALGVTGVDMLAAKKNVKGHAGSIGFTGFTTLFRFLKAGNATLSFWEASPAGDAFSGARAGACRLVERRRIRDGETIILDGSRQTYVIEHAEGDMLYLQAMVRAEGAPLVVEYDSDTLGFVAASSTDEASSRIQMMATLLRAMGRDDALPVLEELLASPHFFTRWHIMREMLAMDAEAALPALRRMAAGDPHPEVRDAAGQTLGYFFDEEDEEAPGQGETRCRA